MYCKFLCNLIFVNIVISRYSSVLISRCQMLVSENATGIYQNIHKRFIFPTFVSLANNICKTKTNAKSSRFTVNNENRYIASSENHNLQYKKNS